MKVTYELRCFGCQKTFIWQSTQLSDSPPSYHSRTCRKRNSDSLKTSPIRPCPHPEKKLWSSEVLANRFCADHVRAGQWLRVYRCVCGGFHIGHVRPTLIRIDSE